MSDIEIDCLEYVTGSVARKFLSKYPYIGEKVGTVIGPDSSWAEQMSKCNLIKPLKNMMETAKVLEVVFNEYHTKNTLSKTSGMHLFSIIIILKLFISFQLNTFFQVS